jgi:uncharacterized protein YceK
LQKAILNIKIFMHSAAKSLTILAICLSTNGCGTITSLEKGDTTPYGGLYQDMCAATSPIGLVFFPFIGLDLILSALADTAILPATGISQIFRSEEDKKKTHNCEPRAPRREQR